MQTFGGLSTLEVIVVLPEGPGENTLKVEHQATTLSLYSVRLDSDQQITEVKNARRLETHFRSPQLDLWQLQMDYLRQMQNSFAGELSLPQALRDLTNVVPGSLNLDWRPQLLPGDHLREPGQIFRSRTTIEFCIHIQPVESRSPSVAFVGWLTEDIMASLMEVSPG